MRLTPLFSRIAAAVSLAGTLFIPTTLLAEETASAAPPVDTDTYVLLPAIALAACTKDGYMHFYGGPVSISQTDLDRLGKTKDDFNIDEYAIRLQEVFTASVIKYDSDVVFKSEGVIGIGRDLRSFAKTYEAETGISSGFLPLYLDISAEPDSQNCQIQNVLQP